MFHTTNIHYITKSFLIILLLNSIYFTPPAWSISSSFRHDTIANGPSGNAAPCLLQAQSGYIRSGTSDGLDRFDSANFKTFRHLAGDTASLGNNITHSLFEDSKGNLWICTENGVFRYQASEEKFSAFPLPDIPDCPVQKIIYSIQEDRQGKIWISVYGNGTFRYNPSDGKIRHYDHEAEDKKSASSDRIVKIPVDHSREVIILFIILFIIYTLLLHRINQRRRNKIIALHHDNERKLSDARINFFTNNTLTGTQADEKWFARLYEIIQENIDNTGFSVDQLARCIHTSRTLLYTKVKAVTGLTPNEFIRSIRLRKAAEYLADHEYKINEICYMVGFNSPSYFAKCFQNQFGVLPKDFINNNSYKTRTLKPKQTCLTKKLTFKGAKA